MLILIRNDGDHIMPLKETQELLVKVLDRTGRHISVLAVTEDSNSNEITIAVEPPLVEYARVVLRDGDGGEDLVELTTADIVARKAAAAATDVGPTEADRT